jgi:hypothetical protein
MQMMRRWIGNRYALSALLLYSFLFPMGFAQAGLVNYSFTGSIDGISSSLFLVNGSFTFEKNMRASGGTYNGVVKDFALNIGGIGYTSVFKPGANAVTISQNMPLGSGIVDRWALVTAATGPDLNGTGFTPFSFDLRVDHHGGGLFVNDNLQNPPSLDSLTTGRWRLFFEDNDGNPAAFLGSISSLSLTAVPLPAGVLLFGAGLISLVGLGAGGLRNLRGCKA